MNSYLLYIFISSTTIASPGPGVVMTLTNSLKFGLRSSIFGILGISLGMFILASIAGGGIGILIAKSELAYLMLKILGASYLLYIGVKLIKNRNSKVILTSKKTLLPAKKFFCQGLGITLVNPKPILFFISLFPHFINNDQNYFSQFAVLSITFCLLIVSIHILYGIFANLIRHHSKGYSYLKFVNIIGGWAYIVFALKLLIPV
ncbi:MAG: LysE family translocator [Crocosphaera sp.]|nr:LysE family translocator [Crocosphaera sp.]